MLLHQASLKLSSVDNNLVVVSSPDILLCPPTRVVGDTLYSVGATPPSVHTCIHTSSLFHSCMILATLNIMTMSNHDIHVLYILPSPPFPSPSHLPYPSYSSLFIQRSLDVRNLLFTLPLERGRGSLGVLEVTVPWPTFGADLQNITLC